MKQTVTIKREFANELLASSNADIRECQLYVGTDCRRCVLGGDCATCAKAAELVRAMTCKRRGGV